MAPRKKPEPPRKSEAQRIAERTPVAEWVAAALGLLLTLGVIGFLVWEAVNERQAPPNLSITSGAVVAVDGGFTVPLTVRNRSYATAGQVEIRGALEQGGVAVEERRSTFTYVPGRGEATGGLVFRNDPRRYRLRLEAEGYQDP